MKPENYSDRPGKRFVQNLLLSYTSGMRCNALILAGPATSMNDYVTTINNTISRTPNATITSFETDKDVFAAQSIAKGHLSSTIAGKLHLFNDDVINARPERFIDLDLMCNINTADPIISKVFRLQKHMPTMLRKSFLFTVALRRAGIIEVAAFLSDLLGTEIKYLTEIELEYGTEYVYTNTGKYLVKVISYRDGMTMLSCLISY